MKHFRKDRAKPAHMVQLLSELRVRVVASDRGRKLGSPSYVTYVFRAERLLLHWWHVPRKVTMPFAMARALGVGPWKNR